MIGQQKLKQKLDKSLPKFIIFVGPKGSGKKTIIKEYFDGIYAEDNKIDSIRKLIDMAYRVRNQYFIMPDADTMSVGAKNALLKVVEECPNNNTFIMTLEDIDNTLPTIRSRAVIYYMDNYKESEIIEYAKQFTNNDVEISIIKDVCSNPGEVELLCRMGVSPFYQYVEKVLDNICTVSGSNSFKIADKVSLKVDEPGYDLKLFWKTFCRLCFERMLEDTKIKYLTGIKITSQYIKQLRKITLNKKMLMDNWILDIREAWR